MHSIVHTDNCFVSAHKMLVHVLIAKASSVDSDESVQTHFFLTDPSLLPCCKHCSSWKFILL